MSAGVTVQYMAHCTRAAHCKLAAMQAARCETASGQPAQSHGLPRPVLRPWPFTAHFCTFCTVRASPRARWSCRCSVCMSCSSVCLTCSLYARRPLRAHVHSRLPLFSPRLACFFPCLSLPVSPSLSLPLLLPPLSRRHSCRSASVCANQNETRQKGRVNTQTSLLSCLLACLLACSLACRR